jgi:hypothetical protein
MYLKILTVAVLGGLGTAGGDWAYSSPRANHDCCALQLDCCQPASACCYDCCDLNLSCCPDSPCCFATRMGGHASCQASRGDCCALDLPCCNPPSECCFAAKVARASCCAQ